MTQRRAWKRAEEELLISRYRAEGAESVAVALNRSLKSVRSKAKFLGVKGYDTPEQKRIARVVNSSTVDTRFFERMDADVAYVLGFLAGGGIKAKSRKALRIAVKRERMLHVIGVLGLLQSRHQIQNYGDRVVVEVGNSYLVDSLLDKFDWPPRRECPNPTLPQIDDSLLVHFAEGHLHRNGWHKPGVICWRGLHTHTEELARRIQAIVQVGAPCQNRYGAMLNVAWTAPEDLELLRQWLQLDTHAYDPGMAGE